MTWAVVSFINVIEVIDGEQTEFPIEETFMLYEFHSDEELYKKIDQKISRINSAGAEGMRYCGKNAKEYCLGVRKIKTIFNDSSDIDEAPPSNGTELTHSDMIVNSLHEAKKLAQGKSVYVEYIGDDDE